MFSSKHNIIIIKNIVILIWVMQANGGNPANNDAPSTSENQVTDESEVTEDVLERMYSFIVIK